MKCIPEVERMARAMDTKIGNRVREMRLARGWTLRDVALRFEWLCIEGMEFGKVGRLERGTYRWTTMYAARFALLFDVDVDTILGG